LSVQLKCFVSAHIAFCSSSLNATSSSLLCQCPREHHGFQNQSSETATVTWLMLLADEGHGNRRCQPVDMQVEVVLKFARFRSYETRHGGRGTDRHRPPLLSTKLGGSDRESEASPAFRPFLTMTVTALKFRISIRIHLVCPTIRVHERGRCNRSGVCPAACRDSRNARGHPGRMAHKAKAKATAGGWADLRRGQAFRPTGTLLFFFRLSCFVAFCILPLGSASRGGARRCRACPRMS
jgi:hypothetical protein